MQSWWWRDVCFSFFFFLQEAEFAQSDWVLTSDIRHSWNFTHPLPPTSFSSRSYSPPAPSVPCLSFRSLLMWKMWDCGCRGNQVGFDWERQLHGARLGDGCSRLTMRHYWFPDNYWTRLSTTSCRKQVGCRGCCWVWCSLWRRCTEIVVLFSTQLSARVCQPVSAGAIALPFTALCCKYELLCAISFVPFLKRSFSSGWRGLDKWKVVSNSDKLLLSLTKWWGWI